ncbi:B3 domain-containing protein Os03g0212300-like [Triticum dicoccoides]|uniref:B3 domain-containing protein Os03g0212300-like n=1 Tax=Triticum dicoccoides TaxID=85692 RepID=UPI0018901670|nr:B3 domain-containing protein Os03g0212300-like [Triticum dicoccoides]
MVILRSHRDTETAEMAQQLRDSPDLAGFEFYKLMASGTSWEKLPLPDKFVMELNGRALRDVKLRVEGGGARAWDVEVVANEYGHMHLGRGWKEFVRANGIQLGQLLVFCYDGAALLTVTVFEDSECGRHFCQREEEDDSAEEDESPPPALPGSESSSNDDVHGGGGGAAPSRFTVTLGQCHLGTKKKQYLNVPVEFSQSHGFTEKGRVVLRMRGQQWSVCLKHSNRRKGNARTRTALRYGWNRFRVDNGLHVGDICFFQLVHDAGGDDPVLSVEVRKADGTIVQ